MTVSGKSLVLAIVAAAVVASLFAAKAIIDLRKRAGQTAALSAALPKVRRTPSGEMRLVPYGYTMVDADNLPMQVPAFYIDTLEATNGAYGRAGTPAMPIVDVTFDEARSICEAAGKRLPNPVEWEKAARGENGSRWPWGNADDAGRANLAGSEAMRAGAKPEGASIYGVEDLIGNVWEWVDDRRKPLPRNLETFAARLTPPATKDEPWYAARGGAFDTPLDEALPYKFLVLPARYKAPDLGFRCACTPRLE